MGRSVSIYIRKSRFAGQKGKLTLFVVYMEMGSLTWDWYGDRAGTSPPCTGPGTFHLKQTNALETSHAG